MLVGTKRILAALSPSPRTCGGRCPVGQHRAQYVKYLQKPLLYVVIFVMPVK